MSGLVLAVGALIGLVGVYEMFVGSGDILSERGWSAYIAGAVFIAGGLVTMALGLVVRVLDRLRSELTSQPVRSPSSMAEAVDPMPTPAASMPAPEPYYEPAPTAPVLAEPPIEHTAVEAFHEVPVDPAPQPSRTPPETAPTPHTEPDDWLDHSFAELDREMSARQEASAKAPESHDEPAQPEPIYFEPEPAAVPIEPERLPASLPEEHEKELAREPVQMDQATADEPAETDHATVSAREELAPSDSAVIGRYESEGTSYVMYADGSIDAQSAAGVYRFSSMAELKYFIES